MKHASIFVIAVLVTLAGCGGEEAREPEPLGFNELSDTTEIVRGAPLLDRFECYRMDGGGIGVRGTVELPDETRLQVSLYRGRETQPAGRVQVKVNRHRFETQPIVGAMGPLPVDDYRIEVLTFFNDAWQTPEVLNATRDGRALRGPGVTRDGAGGAAYRMVMEKRL